MRTRALASALLTAALVAGGGGMALGVVLSPPPVPTAIAASAGPISVPVRAVAYDGAAPASLTIVPGEAATLISQIAGRVTTQRCAPGDQVASGSSMLSVNDQPLLFLATNRPLWRDLAPGDTGDDVRALQEELNRLGQPIAADGRFGQTTLAAFRAVARSAGTDSARWAALPADRIVWLPAASVTVERCAAKVGNSVAAGDAIATLPTGIATAKLTSLPVAGLADAHVIRVDDASIPLDANGVVNSGDALARLASTGSFRAATTEETGVAGRQGGTNQGTVTVDGELARADPIQALVLPPAALYGLDGDEACVLSGHHPRRVVILGSELGKTFARVADGTALARVELRPSSPPPCR